MTRYVLHLVVHARRSVLPLILACLPAVAGQGEREGGPDAYGYTWRDSGDSPGPTYEWLDISQTGTYLILSDNSFAGPLSIGFPFPFYGQIHHSLYVSSNGQITFGGVTTAATNSCVPSPQPPNCAISLLWDDLDPTSGSVRWLSDPDNQRFVLQFSNVRGSCGGLCTFQAVLQPGGLIKIQYQSVPPACASASTVGIESEGGSSGLAYRCNLEGGDLVAGLAVQFAPPSPCDNLECGAPTETEPNAGWGDGNSSWNTIQCGDLHCGRIRADEGLVDSDWFLYRHFGGNLSARLETADFNGCLSLREQASGGAILASVDGLPRCYGESLRVENLPAGSYYLVVEHCGALDVDQEQAYTLSLSCDGHACSGHVPVQCAGTEEVEPNEGWNADPPNSSMGEIHLGGEVCGSVWAMEGRRDMDWYRLSLTTTVDLVVDLQADAFDAALFLTELDPAGAVLAAVDEHGICQPERALVLGLGPGDYCLVVGHHDLQGVPVAQRYMLLASGQTSSLAPGVVTDFTLEPCFPNPFNPVTTIAWTQPAPAPVRLVIHDLRGARLAELDLGLRGAGRHRATWDATGLGSGVHFLTLSVGDQRRTAKALLLR